MPASIWAVFLAISSGGRSFAGAAWKSSSGTDAKSSAGPRRAAVLAFGGVGSRSFTGVFGSIVNWNRCGGGAGPSNTAGPGPSRTTWGGCGWSSALPPGGG